MARDAEALKIRPWAVDGDRLDPEQRSPAIDRDRGWTYDFSALEGEVLSREVFNQLMCEITTMLDELNRGGSIPEYIPFHGYKRGAMVINPIRRFEDPAEIAVCFRDEPDTGLDYPRPEYWRAY